MRLFFLLFALSGCTPILEASSIATDELRVVRVVSVYDGDTLRVDLACYQPLFCSNMPIRIRGIDTPEIRGKCEREKQQARQARDALKGLIEQASKEGREVVLGSPERGKYFRLIADIKIDGLSIGPTLIKKGFARPYEGGTRSDWCI